MAKKDKDGDEAGGSKVKLLVVAAVAIALGAFGGMKVLGGSPAASATEAATEAPEPGPVVVLDPITLNLADTHLLQVGLALELTADAVELADVGDDDPTKGFAKALDAAIDVLGDESMASLTAAGGRDAAKAALEQALGELYDGAIAGVYFHQFVMQ